MKLIDTHTHLYDEQFKEDIAQVIERSLEAQVVHALLPNIDSTSIEPLKALLQLHPSYFKGMMGLHPCSVNADWEKELSIIKQELEQGSYMAVGEIGLDYHWDLSFQEEQKHVFREQLGWAKNKKLPISIHSRKAYADILKILKEEHSSDLRGVLHCFGGDLAEAHKGIEMGFYLGIGGVVSYKNSSMAEIVRAISLDHIVLETDAPYLPPVPYRGKRNESSYIHTIAAFIADLKGISLEEVALATTQNAEKIFSL